MIHLQLLQKRFPKYRRQTEYYFVLGLVCHLPIVSCS